MSYPAPAVANFIIEKASRRGISITPMKLQKLLYFAHGWYLALTGSEPLVADGFEAWDYGPVSPSAYHWFKEFGNKAIPIQAPRSFNDDPKYISGDESAVKVVDKILEVYGSLSGGKLSDMTHEKDAPWDTVYSPKRKFLSIPDKTIEAYFLRELGSDE